MELEKLRGRLSGQSRRLGSKAKQVFNQDALQMRALGMGVEQGSLLLDQRAAAPACRCPKRSCTQRCRQRHIMTTPLDRHRDRAQAWRSGAPIVGYPSVPKLSHPECSSACVDDHGQRVVVFSGLCAWLQPRELAIGAALEHQVGSVAVGAFVEVGAESAEAVVSLDGIASPCRAGTGPRGVLSALRGPMAFCWVSHVSRWHRLPSTSSSPRSAPSPIISRALRPPPAPPQVITLFTPRSCLDTS